MIDFREIRFVFKISLNPSLDQDQYAGLVIICTLIQNYYLRLEYPKKSNFLIQVPILIKAKKILLAKYFKWEAKWIGM